MAGGRVCIEAFANGRLDRPAPSNIKKKRAGWGSSRRDQPRNTRGAYNFGGFEYADVLADRRPAVAFLCRSNIHNVQVNAQIHRSHSHPLSMIFAQLPIPSPSEACDASASEGRSGVACSLVTYAVAERALRLIWAKPHFFENIADAFHRVVDLPVGDPAGFGGSADALFDHLDQ